MTKNMKVLYIGRFQPFHKGHLQLIKSIKDKYKEIIIGIGSAQYSNNVENPFSIQERKMMIEESLNENKITNYHIVEIPDIHNFPKWVSHVVSLVPKFDIVISNSELTSRLFENEGYKVIKTKLYNRGLYSGENIRKNISIDKSWRNCLPKPVIKIIEDKNGIERIKNLFQKK